MLNAKVFLIACLVIYAHAHMDEGTDEEKKAERVENILFANINLLKFGYSEPDDIGKLMVDGSTEFQSDLKDYQSFAGIPVTGELDEATLKQMHKARCGDRDPKPHHRVRRWNHQGTKWENDLNMKLRWKLYNKPGRGSLSKDDVLIVLRQAFEMWSNVTNVQFTETPDEVEPEIKVTFVTGSHGDGYPFDGKDGTLAHAFYPLNNKGLAGDVHFDDDETYSAFTKPVNGQRDLMWVATHELGHSLGMEHSHEKDSIMYPWYPRDESWKPKLKLKYDDINGIQHLYGGKRKPNPNPTPNPKPSTNPKPKTTPKPRPVHGGWSSWKRTGSCSKTCGAGKIPMTRTCTNPIPSNGGRKCLGDSTRQGDCNSRHCPPVPIHGGWSNWIHHGSCDKSCGDQGRQYQYRQCDNPRPRNGGRSCTGVDRMFADCNRHACPAPTRGPCVNKAGDKYCNRHKANGICKTRQDHVTIHCVKACTGCKS